MFPGVTSPPSPESLRDQLVADLRLEATADPDRFVGQNVLQPFGRVFGGQVLGQSLMAAGQTVEAGRARYTVPASEVEARRGKAHPQQVSQQAETSSGVAVLR